MLHTRSHEQTLSDLFNQEFSYEALYRASSRVSAELVRYSCLWRTSQGEVPSAANNSAIVKPPYQQTSKPWLDHTNYGQVDDFTINISLR